MVEKTIQELEQEYNLELDKIIALIKKDKAKSILLQFPDGLKPYSTTILDELENLARKNKLKVRFSIWFSSCFGACDIPPITKKQKIDLIVQFGHSSWNYNKDSGIECS